MIRSQVLMYVSFDEMEHGPKCNIKALLEVFAIRISFFRVNRRLQGDRGLQSETVKQERRFSFAVDNDHEKNDRE